MQKTGNGAIGSFWPDSRKHQTSEILKKNIMYYIHWYFVLKNVKFISLKKFIRTFKVGTVLKKIQFKLVTGGFNQNK